MANIQFFDKLIALPLFVGMSRTDLEQIIEKTKFQFSKADAGTKVVCENDRSGQLLLLVGGEVEMSTRSDDHTYTVTERLCAPLAVQPEFIFGIAQRYTCTLQAVTVCHFITISKAEALRLTSESLIFRLNLLNLLSNAYQRRNRILWRNAPKTLRQRVCRFLCDHCQTPAGRKVFAIPMNRMAQDLNSTRSNISRVLNEMRREGLVTLSRGRIEIEHIEKIV